MASMSFPMMTATVFTLKQQEEHTVYPRKPQDMFCVDCSKFDNDMFSKINTIVSKNFRLRHLLQEIYKRQFADLVIAARAVIKIFCQENDLDIFKAA